MTLGLKGRVMGFLLKNHAEPEQISKTFRDLVIEAGRYVAISGNRQTVELHQTGEYGQNFGQAKALVMAKDHKYSLKEARIFEDAARIVLDSVPKLRHLKAYTNQFRLPDGKGWEVRLYLR